MAKLSKSGLNAEQTILNIFKFDGAKLQKSTEKDDILLDVDAYHKTLGNVSIKSQSDKYQNIALEVRQICERNNSFIDGWFVSGKANYYIIALRDDSQNGFIHTVYLINKEKLSLYVKRANLRDVKSYKAAKLNKTRKYNLPVVKLVSIEALQQNGIIEKTFRRKSQITH